MRERNLYLEKCRQIEEFGEQIEWGGDESYDSEDPNHKGLTEEQRLL